MEAPASLFIDNNLRRFGDFFMRMHRKFHVFADAGDPFRKKTVKLVIVIYLFLFSMETFFFVSMSRIR